MMRKTPETGIAETDVAIIGAGPSGLAAIETFAGHNLRLAVIDEQQAAGGQIYRQPPKGFTAPDWLAGKLYSHGKALLRKAEAAADVDWRFGTTVLGIFRDPAYDGHLLWLWSPGRLSRLRARAVLLAPGCYDMPVPFPGWMLPGVMATGGIQAFVKSQQIVPGNRFLFVGSHPLQLIVADQVIKGGGDVAGVVFSQGRSQFLKSLTRPDILWRHRTKFIETAKVMRRLRNAGVPVLFNRMIASANGDDRLTSATLQKTPARNGRMETMECDRLGVCYGFLPSSELARQAGADSRWDGASGGGWIVDHDDMMRTSVPGLYVAGEITRVAGAEIAAGEGRLAAAGILLDQGRIDQQKVIALANPVRRRLLGLNAFAARLRNLAMPPTALLDGLMDDDTILCRCEAIAVKDFKAILKAAPHLATADALKLAGRTGMGMCQGRYCGHTVVRLLAAAKGCDEDKVGAFTPRPPVKPVPIRDLIRK